MDDRQQIVAYIRANRGRYTDEALRDALVAGGSAPGTIEEAFLEADRLAAIGEAEGGHVDLRWATAGVALALYVVAFVIAALVLRSSAAQAQDWLSTGIANAAQGILALLLVVSFLISLVPIYRRRVSDRGRIVTSILVGLIVPVALLSVVTGACLAVAA